MLVVEIAVGYRLKGKRFCPKENLKTKLFGQTGLEIRIKYCVAVL